MDRIFQRQLADEVYNYIDIQEIRRRVFSCYSQTDDIKQSSDTRKLMKEVDSLVAFAIFNSDGDVNPSEPDRKAIRIKLKYMVTNDGCLDRLTKETMKIFKNATKVERVYNRTISVRLTQEKGGFRIDNSMQSISFHITRAVYNKLSSTIKSNFSNYVREIVYLTILRYIGVLNSRNCQLGLDYEKWGTKDYDIELCASPINRTLPLFCSAFPDIDSYYQGSLGSMLKLKFQSGKRYTFNPPFESEIMVKMAKHVVDELEATPNAYVFAVLPMWDYHLLKSIGRKADPSDERFVAMEILLKSWTIRSSTVFMHENYTYIDHYTGDYRSVVDSIHFVLGTPLEIAGRV